MAFQPIGDLAAGEMYGYEARVCATAGESAGEILARVDADSLYRFDQAGHIRALELTHALGARGRLSINFRPNAAVRA